MVNERYEGESQEEGEYHFSDDQANYDMETESAKDSAAVAVAPKESITEKLKQHRRIVIGIVVFIVLLGIVYKLVTPSSSPVTDFQPGADGAIPAKASTTKTVTQTAPASIQQPASPVITQPATATITTTTQTPANVAAPVPAQAATTQPVEAVQPVLSAAPAGQPTTAQPAAVTTTITTTAPVGNIADRVATLEQQNSAMMNLMQTQYAQKMADSELQNTQLRTQVQELTARISNMEVAFRQLTKILQNNGGATATIPNRSVMSAPAARVIQPKISFTVQAIIPGRAWLKSDSGDTVTVAEGDMLKGYGRISKIDPYDGIVAIDTGSRILTLAYGANGD